MPARSPEERSSRRGRSVGGCPVHSERARIRDLVRPVGITPLTCHRIATISPLCANTAAAGWEPNVVELLGAVMGKRNTCRPGNPVLIRRAVIPSPRIGDAWVSHNGVINTVVIATSLRRLRAQ